MTVTGNHMAGATVSLNGVTLKNTVNRLGTSMKVTVSVTSVTGDLVVASIGGSATSSKLTVRSPSAISLGDKSGRVKSSLTIKGKNLAGVNRLMFNGGVTVTKFKVSDSRIVVVVPSGAETGPVTLYSAQAPAGVTTPPFTVLN